MKILRQSIIATIVLFVLCGLIYPYAMTGIGQMLFKEKANGSIIYKDGKAIGSALIGQQFTEDKYFQGRPSAYGYNTYDEKPADDVLPASGGTNYGNSNPAYIENVQNNLKEFLAKNPTVKAEDVPSELVTASGSGLDPHITVQGAMIQIDRVANARNISKEVLVDLIEKIREKDDVNVLKLNLALDELNK